MSNDTSYFVSFLYWLHDQILNLSTDIANFLLTNVPVGLLILVIIIWTWFMIWLAKEFSTCIWCGNCNNHVSFWDIYCSFCGENILDTHDKKYVKKAIISDKQE